MNKIVLEWQTIVNIDGLISIENELKGMSAIYVWGWFDIDRNFVPSCWCKHILHPAGTQRKRPLVFELKRAMNKRV